MIPEHGVGSCRDESVYDYLVALWLRYVSDWQRETYWIRYCLVFRCLWLDPCKTKPADGPQQMSRYGGEWWGLWQSDPLTKRWGLNHYIVMEGMGVNMTKLYIKCCLLHTTILFLNLYKEYFNIFLNLTYIIIFIIIGVILIHSHPHLPEIVNGSSLRRWAMCIWS